MGEVKDTGESPDPESVPVAPHRPYERRAGRVPTSLPLASAAPASERALSLLAPQ